LLVNTSQRPRRHHQLAPDARVPRTFHARQYQLALLKPLAQLLAQRVVVDVCSRGIHQSRCQLLARHQPAQRVSSALHGIDSCEHAKHKGGHTRSEAHDAKAATG
jgi:hypothetical protein